MAGSDRAANFVVAAKDAASATFGKIGGALGKLKGAASTAFKAMAVGAIAAAGALAALTIDSIKGAAEDERATIRLNAALNARGFAMESLGPKVEDQIKAMARLGFTDDQVRDGLEAGSRFFKKQSDLLQANSVAANIAAATGKDLSDVMMTLGKGAFGQTKGLKALGIEVKKGATAQDIFTAANQKYAGIADEIANSTSGKFTTAQIDLNEQLEAFGYKFLPAVNTALGFLVNNVLPAVTPILDEVFKLFSNVGTAIGGPGGIGESIGKVVGPILDELAPAFGDLMESITGVFGSVGDLIGALWGDGDGALAAAFTFLGDAIGAAFEVAKPFFDFIKWMVDNITTIIKGANALAGGSQNNVGFNPSYGTQPGAAGGGYKYGNTGTAGAVTVQNTIKFGNDAVSYIDTKLGQTYSYGSSRTNP